MRLIVKLLAGIVLGLLIGLFAPRPVTELLVTVQSLLGELLFFVIPLLILFFITSGIAALPRESGRLLGRALGSAYASTVVAGTLAFLVAALVIPWLAGEASGGAVAEAGEITPWIAVEVPPVFGVMTALVLAFLFGTGIAATGADRLQALSDQGRGVIQWLLERVIIPLLPLYIGGVFAELAATGTVFETLRTFGVVLLLAVTLHWCWIAVIYALAGLRSGHSPVALLKNMLPAYFTALGTMSSAVTIPVTLQCAKRNGVRTGVADFAIPLFATVHLAGSTITIVSCAVAVMVMQDGLAIPSVVTMFPFILMLGLVMLAAPGVPGGAVISAVGLLGDMLGFGEAAVALMIALYMAQDSLGTACNVTCDGALAVLVDQAGKTDVPGSRGVAGETE